MVTRTCAGGSGQSNSNPALKLPSKRGSQSRPERPFSITARRHHGNTAPRRWLVKGRQCSSQPKRSPHLSPAIGSPSMRCVGPVLLLRPCPGKLRRVPCPCRRPSGLAGHQLLSRAGYRGAEGQARHPLSRHPGCSRIVLALGVNVRNASLPVSAVLTPPSC